MDRSGNEGPRKSYGCTSMLRIRESLNMLRDRRKS